MDVLFANLVLIAHVGFIVFVLGGQILIVSGALLRWSWIRNFRFRVLHLVAIGLVVLQSWCGIACPLTTLENFFRSRAGQAIYQQSFIADWLHRLIFFQASPWVFGLVYSVFGAVVLLTWWLAPPHRSNLNLEIRPSK